MFFEIWPGWEGKGGWTEVGEGLGKEGLGEGWGRGWGGVGEGLGTAWFSVCLKKTLFEKTHQRSLDLSVWCVLEHILGGGGTLVWGNSIRMSPQMNVR